MTREQLDMPECVCQKCNWHWIPRTRYKPKKCPHCMNPNWEEPYKQAGKRLKTDILNEYYGQYCNLREAIRQSGGTYTRDIVMGWARQRAGNLDLDPDELIDEMEDMWATRSQ